MNTTRTLFASLLFAAAAVVCLGDAITDAELKQDVWEYLTTRFCGSRGGRRIAHPRILTDYIRFDGNTNRLATVLVEVACSNNTWAAGRAFKELEKYGTAEQLPFLYSCATNPVVGDRAMKAMLRIDGVTSNSVAAVEMYFLLTNVVDSADRSRTSICADLIRLSNVDGVDPICRSNALAVAHDFAFGPSCNYYWLDSLLIEDDSTYRFSKRRIAFMRGIAPYAAQWRFMANYVTNAINELVAYPEANLPD